MITSLDLNNRYGRFALRLSLSCFLVVMFYQYFHIEHGYWAAFSVIACVVPTAGQSLQRSRQRIFGTFIGMVIGIIVAHTFGKSLLYTDLLIAIFVFLTVYLKTLSYSYYVTFNTVIAVLFVCLIIPGDWQVALVRLEMTVVGVIIAMCATYLVLPVRVSTATPLQLQELKSNLQKYYLSICQTFLDSKQNSLHLPRLEAFSIMQNTAAIIKESELESWNQDLRYQHHADIYANLEKIYQILLILETDIPNGLKEVELQDFIDPIKHILLAISLLFNNAAKQPAMNDIQELLQKLLYKINTLRINAMRDIAIPMATFKEHIQLVATLNKLSNLIVVLQDLQKIMVNAIDSK